MKALFLSVLLALPCMLQAQHFKLVKATSQSWAAGIPGHYGIRYVITFQADASVAMDTVWIGKRFYTVSLCKGAAAAPGCNTSRQLKGKRATYTVDINITQAPAEAAGNDNNEQADKIYPGEAQLVGHGRKGQRYHFNIARIQGLPMNAYP